MSWVSYNDGELAVFHPLCEKALIEALKTLNQENCYTVEHHLMIDSLQLDFAIINRKTKKIICIVEVKRTRMAVESSRFQFQAMSYVQAAGNRIEKPYYVVTNLETCALFYYSANKSTPRHQLQAPGVSTIGSFSENKQDFLQKLVCYFSFIIDKIIKNEVNYAHTLNKFINFFEQTCNTYRKLCLIPCLYEYIRGVFNKEKIPYFYDINTYKRKGKFNLLNICKKVTEIDFSAIFNSNIKESPLPIPQDILSELYQYSNNDTSGCSISSYLYENVSSGNESYGEVSTDPELARIVAILAKRTLNKPLRKEDKVCDPAAGSGILLLETAKEFNLEACQLVANDIKPEYADILALRLGLNFVHTLKAPNTPTITSSDVADLTTNYFNDVKLVVLNPPYLSGINDTTRKEKLFASMMSDGITPQTNIGQMALEGAFIELLLNKLQKDTTVALIIPERHLLSLGKEAIALRKMLLNKLGLNTIFTYPCEGIFNRVTISTCVLIGKTNNSFDNVCVLRSLIKISDIDISQLNNIQVQSNSSFQTIFSGVEGSNISYDNLYKTINSGWRELSSIDKKAISFLTEIKEKANLIQFQSKYSLRRGSIGNQGCSNFLFLKKHIYSNFKNNLFCSSIKNSDGISFLFKEDSKFPLFSECEKENPEIIDNIISAVINKKNNFKRKQKKKEKTEEQIKTILQNSEQKVSSGYNILIPRASRTTGSITFTEDNVYVSTNFLICNLKNKEDALLLGSWMNTVFYQLDCFMISKNQEGMRKLEKIAIDKTYVPNLNTIEIKEKKRLLSTISQIKPVDFIHPELQEIDIVWADILFGEQANTILNLALEHLQFVTSIR